MENHKIQYSMQKLNYGFESRLRVGKVLASYNARPKVIPLIKRSKRDVFILNIHFSHK